MLITKELIAEIVESVNSPERREMRLVDYKRWLMFNGATEGVIREAISREFKKPETVEELVARLIPINFMQKIITKLAGVFTQPPIRRVADRSTSDQELLDLFVEALSLEQRDKEGNRYFKLFKRNLSELYVDENGRPHKRNLPRHTYEVFSFSALTPNRPDVICKIIKDDKNLEKQKLVLWSNESQWLVNGKGEIIIDAMQAMNNIDGVNPYGALPFIYINESSCSVDPVQDDDLFRLSIAIPVILTDICFATKYQAWSMIYTIGDVGEVPMNPNSVLPLNFGPNGERPEIGQIKPEVDTDKVISMVQTLVALLLSTKSLSVNTVQAKLDSVNVASGISKMLDQAESVEDKKDQQAYFRDAETEQWNLIKNNLLPAWRASQSIAPEFDREFSKNFVVDIYFKEPQVLITEKEQIELSKLRLDSGFSTLKMELKAIYPQLTEEQIDELIVEIENEKANKATMVADSIDSQASMDEVEEENDEEDSEDDDQDEEVTQ